jgi:hypothetical protein
MLITSLSSAYIKSLLLPVLCCGLLVACQPPERPNIAETRAVTDSSKVNIDLNERCAGLNQEMQQVNHERTVLALQQINQDLKLCLPLIATDEQLKLLDLSHYMYDSFLSIQRSPTEQIAFEQYVNTVNTHPTLQQENFAQMNLRDQYLVKHQGQAYIEIVTLADGSTAYRRNPQYLARIFAPYLPEAEQSFIHGLANQNTQTIFAGEKLSIEPSVIAERALFWESYLNNYPKSRYKSDAQYLYQAYSQLLFTGTSEQKVSDNYSGTHNINPQSLAAIKYVSQQTNSHLARQANQFLSFVQRDTHSYALDLEQEHQAAVRAVESKLGLVKISFKDHKNCFADAVCL